MDTQQIVALFVAALIGAVAKELVSWLIATFKSLSFLATAKEKLKSLLTKDNLSLAMDFAALSFSIYLLVNFTKSPSPPTRQEILLAMGLVVAAITFLFSILFAFARMKYQRLTQKKNIG